MSDKMNNKKISSFEIKKHNKFSWSYVYTIDGRKYDIHGGSTYDLRKKVLAEIYHGMMKIILKINLLKHSMIP